MSDFKIGDRVRAKHDHTFEGEVSDVDVENDTQIVEVCTDNPAESPFQMRASWLEPVPKPLNPLVPWDVLTELFGEVHDPKGVCIALKRLLREKGYGE